MKVKILEKDKNFLRLEIEGEGHTLSNFLQALLLQEIEVEIAGYNKPHPLTESAILYLRTKGKASPEEVLMRAAEKGKKQTEEFHSIFEKEIAKQESAQKQSSTS
jgi:DNA-directed RNA polymerase subunit L